MSEELTTALDSSEQGLRRIAKRLLRDLEDLHDRHTTIEGLTPEGRQREHADVVQRHHESARGIRAQWAAVVGRAKDRGEEIPDPPDLSLVDEILKVRDLDDARTLAANLEA